ncbi:TPA: ead/Ea22-like family protein [Salmonella enterica]|nr:ead/Ea22-like family protein [Salmonella enterica]
MNIDKRALREVAEKATKGPWKVFSDIDTKTFSIHTPRDKRCENVIKWGGFDCQPNAEANAEFIAAFNPKVALALLDENIQLQREKDAIEAVALALRDDMRQARKQLADAGRLIADLDKCLIEYAGIATREARRVAELGSFHTAYLEWSDKTEWVQTDKRFDVIKPWGKHRADVLREYIEHLEARQIALPQRLSPEGYHIDEAYMVDDAEGEYLDRDAVIEAISAAGIKVI